VIAPTPDPDTGNVGGSQINGRFELEMQCIRVDMWSDSIPFALKSLKRWVAWRVLPPKKAGDKFGKRPVNPHSGKPASTTNEATWGTFDEAVARMQ